MHHGPVKSWGPVASGTRITRNGNACCEGVMLPYNVPVRVQVHTFDFLFCLRRKILVHNHLVELFVSSVSITAGIAIVTVASTVEHCVWHQRSNCCHESC